LIEKKEEGNQYFQMKKYEKACEMYMQAISGLTTGDTEQEKEIRCTIKKTSKSSQRYYNMH